MILIKIEEINGTVEIEAHGDLPTAREAYLAEKIYESAKVAMETCGKGKLQSIHPTGEIGRS